MFGLSKALTGAIAGLILVALVLGLLQVRSCTQAKQQAAQSRVDQGQQGALRNSAADAVGTVGAVAGNQAAGEAIGRTNEEEIRNAKGADARVDPDANDAGLRALCRRASHRDDPACRLQQPRPH